MPFKGRALSLQLLKQTFTNHFIISFVLCTASVTLYPGPGISWIARVCFALPFLVFGIQLAKAWTTLVSRIGFVGKLLTGTPVELGGYGGLITRAGVLMFESGNVFLYSWDAFVHWSQDEQRHVVALRFPDRDSDTGILLFSQMFGSDEDWNRAKEIIAGHVDKET